MPNPPIWITLSLKDSLTAESFAASATKSGVRAEVAARGPIQLPHGFIAFIDPQPFPGHLVDRSSTKAELKLGPACLHISGGTHDMAIAAHRAPASVRAMKAEMARDFALISSPPNMPGSPRIISEAGLKVERMTALVRGLLPLATTVILPQASHMGFSADEFSEMSSGYGDQNYHFPLYVFLKVRPDPDGPYASSTGMTLFGLPEIAIPLGDHLGTREAARAVGNLQREMVAEGLWPEDGSEFATEIGSVSIAQVQDALFIVPTDLDFDDDMLAVARHRWALERCAVASFGRSTMYRVRSEGTDLIVDHHLLEKGSFAMTNGLSLTPQPGGSPEDENEFVELLLFCDKLGPWATNWLRSVGTMVRGHDGSHPLLPYSRTVNPEPVNGIAAIMLWPWGYFTPFGVEDSAEDGDDDDDDDDKDDDDKDEGDEVEDVDAADGADADDEAEDDDAPGLLETERARVHLWVLVPILTEELARFRAAPNAARDWVAERIARKDLHEVHRRWTRGT